MGITDYIMEHEVLLTPIAVQEWLGISQGTLAKLVKNGKLPVITIGRQRRFKKEDVLDFINKNRSEDQ